MKTLSRFSLKIHLLNVTKLLWIKGSDSRKLSTGNLKKQHVQQTMLFLARFFPSNIRTVYSIWLWFRPQFFCYSFFDVCQATWLVDKRVLHCGIIRTSVCPHLRLKKTTFTNSVDTWLFHFAHKKFKPRVLFGSPVRKEFFWPVNVDASWCKTSWRRRAARRLMSTAQTEVKENIKEFNLMLYPFVKRY